MLFKEGEKIQFSIRLKSALKEMLAVSFCIFLSHEKTGVCSLKVSLCSQAFPVIKEVLSAPYQLCIYTQFALMSPCRAPTFVFIGICKYLIEGFDVTVCARAL